MKLDVKWEKPIELKDGDSENLIYTIKGIEKWVGVPGVYMFARIYDGAVSPLYIGKAENIGVRAYQHIKSNTRLMKGISKSPLGTKVFIPGVFSPRPGQKVRRCIELIERALIDHALTEGYPLLNVHGTKTPFHEVHFAGFLGARNVTGKKINVKAQG